MGCLATDLISLVASCVGVLHIKTHDFYTYTCVQESDNADQEQEVKSKHAIDLLCVFDYKRMTTIKFQLKIEHFPQHVKLIKKDVNEDF